VSSFLLSLQVHPAAVNTAYYIPAATSQPTSGSQVGQSISKVPDAVGMWQNP
jgi:hypothetical protein